MKPTAGPTMSGTTVPRNIVIASRFTSDPVPIAGPTMSGKTSKIDIVIQTTNT